MITVIDNMNLLLYEIISNLGMFLVNFRCPRLKMTELILGPFKSTIKRQSQIGERFS